MKWYLLPVYIAEEYWLILLNHIRSYFYRNPPASWSKGDKENVILIPGLHQRWPSMMSIGNVLNRRGYRIHIINRLGRNTTTVETGCRIVSKYIVDNGLKNIILITHSKGGLIAATLLKDAVISKRIKKIITIACPYGGSLLAAFWPLSKEIKSSSPLINNLCQGINARSIGNIYPRIDNFVIPNKNLLLDGCQNRQINIFGHVRILESSQIISEILKSLHF